MFIGHYAVAFALAAYYPEAALAAFLGVALPDLLWGALVLLGIEKADMGSSRKQTSVRFTHYPYSHSLILTSLIAAGIGLPFLLVSSTAWIVFIAASASHWLLDAIVHVRDLPVLGIGNDTKVGFGLWRIGPLAFFVELAIYVISAIIFVQRPELWWVLVIGVGLHVLSAKSSFAHDEDTQSMTTRTYAVSALSAFLVASLLLWMIVV